MKASLNHSFILTIFFSAEIFSFCLFAHNHAHVNYIIRKICIYFIEICRTLRHENIIEIPKMYLY